MHTPDPPTPTRNAAAQRNRPPRHVLERSPLTHVAPDRNRPPGEAQTPSKAPPVLPNDLGVFGPDLTERKLCSQGSLEAGHFSGLPQRPERSPKPHQRHLTSGAEKDQRSGISEQRPSGQTRRISTAARAHRITLELREVDHGTEGINVSQGCTSAPWSAAPGSAVLAAEVHVWETTPV